MKFFRPGMDRLESRRLMAGDISQDCIVATQVGVNAGAADIVVAGSAMAPPTATAQAAAEVAAEGEAASSNPIIDYAFSTVIVRSGSTVVVAGHTSSLVTIITQADGDSPKVAHSLNLSLGIQDVAVDGQRAIVYGQRPDDRTEVVAIDLASGKIVNRLQFGPGAFGFASLVGSDAWLVLNQSTLVDGQPRDSSVLLHLQWTDSGLVKQASLAVPAGIWSIAKDRLIMATTSNASDVTTKVHLYDIGQGRLSELSTHEFKNSYIKSIVISDDGQRASIIRGSDATGFNPQTIVDLLSLEDSTIAVQQSFTIDDWTEIQLHDADQAILFGQVTHQVVAIDLRPDSGSPNSGSQTRMQSWDVPESIRLSGQFLALSNGRFALAAYVFDFGPFFNTAQPAAPSLPDGTYLVIIDPKSGQVQTPRLNGLSGRMFSIDANTSRIGILGSSPLAGSLSSSFTYGHIEDSGRFVEEKTFLGVDRGRDTAVVFSNRLVTAADDRVSIFDLGNSGAPLLVERVDDPAPELIAGDWNLRVPKHGMLLEALMLPASPSANFHRTRIIGLEGAPEGVEILNSHEILFAPYEQSDRPDAEFQYVITDGIDIKRGRIRVTFTDEYFPRIPPTQSEDLASEDLASDAVDPPSVVTRNTDSTVDVNLKLLKHNAAAPLDVNDDGNVTVLDVLLVVNALNSSLAQWSSYWLDTNNDGLLQPIDALLIINQLNGPVPTPPAPGTVVQVTEEELFEIRTVVMQSELASYKAAGIRPGASILVGFEPDAVVPMPRPTPEDNWEDVVNRSLQRLKSPSPAWLSQPLIKDYVRGPSSLAVQKEYLQNSLTGEYVNVIYIQEPRWDDNGSPRVSMTTNYATDLGAAGIEFKIEKVEGHWRVAERKFSWIS